MLTPLAPARSYLYVPGDRPDRFAKAAASGADAVVLDLEDGVGQAGKDAAHEAVAAHPRTSGPQWWVRLDPARLEDGARSAAQEGTAGVFVPSAEPELLARVDQLLTRVEAERGVRALSVIGLVETARGVAEVRSLAAAPRVHRLGIGEADLAAELGMRPDPERHELWAIRSDVVVASALARIAAPVGPVQIDLSGLEALASSTALLVRQGFAARTLVHPNQVSIVHRALAPTESELIDARAVVAAFENAQGAGTGVAVDAGGRLVDLAVVRSARAVLARAALDRKR
ncbi:aldolase/citrate lyase family protein [Nocardioides sp. LHD-245]|uniref:HpcH/HpaI aldolase/citrate lyase family protein n=1 Tax=Nocardioides sp. LHD-245 TaxID=3051387 RepID=UPI0027E08460|nr:aldolase/citrate lyase family protein [Nocardioides sp. LHD-245]